MNKITLAFIFVIYHAIASAQYHVKVIPNPVHKDQVSDAWVNNYVVLYTNDNWLHSDVIKYQATYVGYDHKNTPYYSSYYEVKSFRRFPDAVSFAKQFRTYGYLLRYEKQEYKNHCELKAKWDKENKNRIFSRPTIHNGKSQNVY